MTTDAHLRKMHVWRHNGFFGSASMAKQNMRAIQQSNSATNAAKAIAREIEQLSSKLNKELKTRVDPWKETL